MPGLDLRKAYQSLANAAAITGIDQAILRRWVDERRIYGWDTSVSTHELRKLGQRLEEARGRLKRLPLRLDVGEPLLVTEAAALCGIPEERLGAVASWIESERLAAELHADGDYWLDRANLAALAQLTWDRFSTREALAILRRAQPEKHCYYPAWIRSLRAPDVVELVEQLLPARPRIQLRPPLSTIERQVKNIVEGMSA